MFELFLPYLIGTALGMSANEGDTQTTQAEVPVLEASGDDIASRTPEPQIPTGKFTTAVEVKPILGMTKGNWVAVRNYNGQDLLYFSHLLAWRCGLWDVRYGINGAPADQVFPLEPCYYDLQTPNSIVDVETYLIYATLPPDSVETVYVEVTFDDGTTDFAQFNRNEIQIP